jgi:hypothetical protein
LGKAGVANWDNTVYSRYIIIPPIINSYSLKNQLDIVLDTADNLNQIGHWTLDCFQKEQKRIELFLMLTRKNLDALHSFDLPSAFMSDFKKFSESFDKLEKEYQTGLVDQKLWANGMIKWASTLTQSSALM